ncbi:RNA polymerase recycling motor HelD [Lacticaseibacillus mingshuiensis]|uniref:RNA polymerase recycling motor HelD n=1 Tax=Lacticaseibacillus mingshuiensis TaxID=2799574 RepID=A0ABW4CJF2_9LACO|nr:RNA polymerase recycling motor HelD [Lacticaseibacillus mingshuiensis]
MELASRDEEQARVTRVMGAIEARLEVVARQIDAAHRETTRVEQAYGDATKVNITETDDRMETNAAVQQQKMMVARAVENETILQHEAQRLHLLQQNPYFGRIDIEEDGAVDTLYIGMGTFIDEKDDFLVYDWRAPIAAIYYNGTLGPVTYETPVGPATVTLLNKRQFTIENGAIRNMFDTSETVGDEILQAVLGQQSDAYMKNIVATIQQEQNDIIRDTKADVLVVQGVAGSGKTSAVLQRVAYLLYHSRKDLDADEMVLFSPNQLFANYISAVLPSLGEKNMRQATLYEFFAKRFSGLQVETLFDRYERDRAGLPESAKRIRRFKENADYLTLIRAYTQTPDQVPFFIDIMLNGEVFFSAETITKIYASQPAKATAANKFTDTKNTLIKRLRQRIKMALGDDWVQDALDALSDEQVTTMLVGRRFATGDQEQRFIAEKLVAKAFAPVYDAIYNDYFLDCYQDYARFLTTIAAPTVSTGAWAAMAEACASDLEHHELRLEDAAPILFLRDTITGGGTNHAIRYVFVDEMQDYSMAQLAYLHHAFPKAKLTLLGDAKQDVFTSDYQAGDFLATIKQVFTRQSVRLITLNKSYRSTRPITDFAKNLLPEHDHILAFNRDGERPVLVTTTAAAVRNDLTRLINEQLKFNNTVAILTRDRGTAEKLFATLQLDVQSTLLTPADHTMKTGCLIMPVYLAKGLEFDAVIGYDISAQTYADEADRDILYTLATRALHHLTLVALDDPSPLLAPLPADSFTTIDRSKKASRV